MQEEEVLQLLKHAEISSSRIVHKHAESEHINRGINAAISQSTSIPGTSEENHQRPEAFSGHQEQWQSILVEPAVFAAEIDDPTSKEEELNFELNGHNRELPLCAPGMDSNSISDQVSSTSHFSFGNFVSSRFALSKV